MLKIEHAKVIGWEAAIRGMRNPMNSWEKSDSCWSYDDTEDGCLCTMIAVDDWGYNIGPNDQALMKTLSNAGSDHRKFMRMITVSLDITAPLYWWKEYDTYKVGTVANSCSTMHKITEKEFTVEDFSCEHLLQRGSTIASVMSALYCSPYLDGKLQYTPFTCLNLIITVLNTYRNYYLELSNIDEEAFKRAPKGHGITDKSLSETRKLLWWQLIQLLPSSYNQKRTVMLNYEVLANIYHSRRNHKLDEWYIFCYWIESLPFSELITNNLKEKEDAIIDF